MQTHEQIEKWLDEIGVSYHYEKEIQLERIDREASLHNQARISAPVNLEQVSHYRAAMENGDKFPPVVGVISKKGKIIIADGNHRIETTRDMGETAYRFGIYLCENVSEMEFRRLLYEANTKHGLPASKEDRVEHAVWLVNNWGSTMVEAAKINSVSVNSVESRVTYLKAEARLRENAGPKVSAISPTSLRYLNAIADDDVFVEAVSIAIESAMTTGQAEALSRDIRSIGTAKKQMAFLAEKKAAIEKTKSESAGVGGAYKAAFRKLDSAISALRRVNEDLIDQVPREMNDQLIERLGAISDMVESIAARSVGTAG